jgi:hypothetical protein
MQNEFGKTISEAGPSQPVQVSGWREQLPLPGEQNSKKTNFGIKTVPKIENKLAIIKKSF